MTELVVSYEFTKHFKVTFRVVIARVFMVIKKWSSKKGNHLFPSSENRISLLQRGDGSTRKDGDGRGCGRRPSICRTQEKSERPG